MKTYKTIKNYIIKMKKLFLMLSLLLVVITLEAQERRILKQKFNTNFEVAETLEFIKFYSDDYSVSFAYDLNQRVQEIQVSGSLGTYEECSTILYSKLYMKENTYYRVWTTSNLKTYAYILWDWENFEFFIAIYGDYNDILISLYNINK